MKRCISIILTILLLVTFVVTGNQTAYAASKGTVTRTIAIVFDNSGSMYDAGNKAWCRATYAMEVFASMLNAGDTLMIYPMQPIEVNGTEYTMESPFKLTDSSKAYMIRDIYTPVANLTPIESVDYAIKGLKASNADEKYLIILTDGTTFHVKSTSMGSGQTKRELDARIQPQVDQKVHVMYLGIGNGVVMPDTKESEYFVKRQAAKSEDVLSSLTDMCNLVFGRDTLPDSYINGQTIEFDMSMKKVIVFVQGENVSNVNISGNIGTKVSESSTKYSTAGCGTEKSVPDTSLQGMMVTYEDCAAGTYTIEYSGTASSIEVYYEPDADVDFVFTDASGKNVDPHALYEGEYKVSFGMKDGKTGKLISSELLGNPHYEGTYYINGQAFPIVHDGHSGEEPVYLNMNDTFEANLTVTYLGGYTITKDSSDFGWPEGGIQVSARPAGELVLEITGGDGTYSLQYLEEGGPYTAKVYYQGQQLTGKELENVDLKWQAETSNAEIKYEFEDDHYNLWLSYKDPEAPWNTVCGECTVTIYASYTAKGSTEAQTEAPITYNIIDDLAPVQMELYTPEDYIVISELDGSAPIIAKLTAEGAKLTPEEFAAVELQVDCGGLDYTVTANAEDSCYEIQLLPTAGIGEGDYPVKVTAVHTDNIGRETQVDDSLVITLSNIPLWVKWAAALILLVLLITIILIILHIRVYPKKAHANKRDCAMYFDGEDESKATTFTTKVEKGRLEVISKFAGTKMGITMDVKPGKESYLRKPQAKRSVEVKSASVRKMGTATIQEATVGSAKYVINEETGKLARVPKNDKPFVLKHGMTIRYSGTMLNAGVPKPFAVTVKLNYKKK